MKTANFYYLVDSNTLYYDIVVPIFADKQVLMLCKVKQIYF